MKKTDVSQLLFELKSCICEMAQMGGRLSNRVIHAYYYLSKYLHMVEPLYEMPIIIKNDFNSLRKLLIDESMLMIENNNLKMQNLGLKKSNWTLESAIRNFSWQQSKQVIKSITILYTDLLELS